MCQQATLDFEAETSLTIAEKLLKQEHIINMKRIEIISRLIIKLADAAPRIKDIMEPELSELVKLEQQFRDLEHTSKSIL